VVNQSRQRAAKTPWQWYASVVSRERQGGSFSS
jgi:hypothetical protein